MVDSSFGSVGKLEGLTGAVRERNAPAAYLSRMKIISSRCLRLTWRGRHRLQELVRTDNRGSRLGISEITVKTSWQRDAPDEH